MNARHLLNLLKALLWSGVLVLAPGLQAQTARVIVGFKADAPALRELPLSRQMAPADAETMLQRRAERMQARAGVALRSGRALSERLQVLHADGLDSERLIERLRGHPEVAYVVADRRQRALRVPADPLFAAGPSNGAGPAVGQWYLRAPSAQTPSAINAERAWDSVTGSAAVVVAVLDSGVLADHPDLAGRVLPGYDFIDVAQVANDGNRRDADPNDPGDWITATETAETSGLFYQCGANNSSWHGTKVSGIIGAIADNGVGMAGTAHGVRILPVRVLGKCGGYDSDIIAGMRWAAGLSVPGVPDNPNPARVLNMSLGSSAACSAAYADVVQQLTARGALVVAAAGNSTGLATGTPANCPGVVAVAGLRHAGSKVGFSDLGSEITISAPGGNCVNIGAGESCLYPILTTSNSGTQAPVAGGSIWTDGQGRITVGTSFAAPLVAGTAALLLSARPQLTPAQIVSALRRSARPFPTSGADNGSDPTPVAQCRPPDGIEQLQCYCTTSTCGAGMLDAAAAVQAVLAPGSVEELAGQLMNFGERNFPQFFPDRTATLSSPPFLYRFYPRTGVYLGVVVQPGLGFTMDGVYVMGGPFGSAPMYVGQLTSFINPNNLPAAASVGAAR